MRHRSSPAVVLFAIAGLAPFAAAQCDPNWTEFTGGGPGPRFVSAAAHDLSRNVDVIFGGAQAISGPAFLGDTWEFDRTARTWAQRATSGPAPRYGIAGAFMGTAAGGAFIIFGGSTVEGGLGVQSDTWSWDGAAWTQLFPATMPAPRYGAVMAYDSARGRVVLFGGFTQNNTPDGETWEFDGANWHFAGSGPAPRAYAGLAYHAARASTVLFGGHTGGTNPVRYNDTWEWNGSFWQQMTPETPPSERFAMVMEYDPAAQHIVMFSGLTGAGLPADLWTYDGEWQSHAQPAPAPGGLAGAVGAMSASGELMMTGGFDGAAVSGQTWFLTCQTGSPCYANCDGSTAAPILNVADFSCFLTKFAGGEPYANCDASTVPPVLNVADFSCFLGKFAAGCP